MIETVCLFHIHPAQPTITHSIHLMKYALLVHHPKEYFEKRNDAETIAAGRAYGEALQAAGVFVGGGGLEGPLTATTVSVRDGKRQVHDGPYAETKEYLAGFGIIDVPDLDAALEWAARHPAAAFSAVEVRPLLGSHFSSGTQKASA
jgi:hypothetical protein